MVCLLWRRLCHLAQPLLITGGMPIKLFRIQIFCQNAQVFHRSMLRHLAQPLSIRGGMPNKLFRIRIFCQNAQVFHRSIPNKIFRIQIFCQNATQVFHRAGLEISISLTKAMLVRMAVLLTGGALLVPLLQADMFVFPLPTLIPAMTWFLAARLPLLASWTVPVWPAPRT